MIFLVVSKKSVLLRLDINKMNYYGAGSNNESSSIANPPFPKVEVIGIEDFKCYLDKWI